jgi:hypothetical protein
MLLLPTRFDARLLTLTGIEGELKKASKAITCVSGLVAKYRGRLRELCDNAAEQKLPSQHQPTSALAQAWTER